ncbi:MAG TPA: prephenate dehydrogenase/arogenate dehydrogenase family protein [Candidatus Eremiobacteraceae bacterium]|nr:prephenate dehydrogenase/arogenate dehydrogenase family protein [Candidatus Eremiobacteraceae bacterium]
MRSTVAILGTGLIGASLGLALRSGSGRDSSRPPRPRIVGWDMRPSNARSALKRRGITEIAASMEEAVREADVVVIGTPLDAALDLAPHVIRAAAKGALILDVTPVKGPMLRAVRLPLRRRPDVAYVSMHPMAGREKGGARNADATLFTGRPFALVVPPHVRSRDALKRASALVERVGGTGLRMSASAHDRAVAAMSALPQLASIALVLAATEIGGRKAALLAGPGFADTTRLALSPYDIWRPAIDANRGEIVRCLRALERVTARVTSAARQADVRAMERLFSKAGSARRRVVAD